MKDYIIIRNESGEFERVAYEELDSEIYPQLWRPVGGFCYSADNFMRLDLPPMPFYIKNWLPKQGKAMLYAPAKSGKSYLCLQIARCIGSGEEFLGIPTSPGKVLYIQCELGEGILKGRMQSTKQDYENVFVGTSFAMKLDTKPGQEKMLEAVDAIRPNVLIIDPWYKIIQGDENESSDARVIIDFLDEIIETFLCSILVIHHPGKDIKKGGRGSSVLEDWVDSYIEMRKVSKNGEPLRVKITPKLYRHAELPPEGLEAEMRGYEFSLTSSKLTIPEQVLRHMVQFGKDVTPKMLFEAGLGSHKALHLALDGLMQEGVVEKVERGIYRLKEG